MLVVLLVVRFRILLTSLFLFLQIFIQFLKHQQLVHYPHSLVMVVKMEVSRKIESLKHQAIPAERNSPISCLVGVAFYMQVLLD